MKKYIVVFFFVGIVGYLSMGFAFAEGGGRTDTDIQAEENNTTQASKKLTLPKRNRYDSLIRHNKISDSMGTGVGLKQGLKNLLSPENKNLITAINYIIGAVALIWLSILGAKFIFSTGDEEKLSNYKKQFGWIVLGLLVVSVAEYAGYSVFSGEQGLSTSESIDNLKSVTEKIITFMQYIIGGVALIAGVRSGYALITGGDDSEVVEKEKVFVKIFLLSIGLILFARSVETWIVLTGGAGKGIEAKPIVREMTGLLNFILMFVAVSALFMTVLASGYYVFSMGNEDITQRAKKMIISSIIASIIAFSAYTIVRFLV